ncbi:ABC transporter ATP-binding protein [Pseudomonas sp. CFBP 8770]|uniref:ABC transporter ATP-binding protein n=1 Tax=unclassified Pseudomonas TaxID=196821 RepID=UPI00177BBCD0|nr:MULTISPECIES: ABC transporter ATP-binding protein [unclassified Pseudomonas]MBD8472865.1 ABC transporter ATP-binding protein [Pseudomonas sp. CFBP 8773]MBD8646032.1 ABC transporter ATP-binding protein [Pseudomonas sp. CFBP 8770]
MSAAPATEPPVAEGAIAQLLRPVRGRLIVAAILASLGTALTLLPLAAIAYLAELALAPADGGIWTTDAAAHVWPVIGGSLGCLVLGMILVSLGEMLAHLLDNQITSHLRLAITRRLGKVPLGWFTARASGEVKQAMQDDVDTLHSLTAHFYTTVGRSLGAVSFATVYLFAMNWRMAVISLLPFPLFFLFVSRATRASSANMQAFGAGMARINNAVVEFVNGITVVKSFGIEGKAQANYRDAVDGFALAFEDFTRPLVGAMANAHALITPVAVLGIVLAFGTLFTWLGWIEAIDLLPFVLVAPSLCAPLLLLSYITHDLHNATAAALRIQQLLATPELARPTQATTVLPARAELQVENLSYSYDGETAVLSNIDLTLRPGTVTAVVGPSGAGKSTLASLLLRFFDPDAGRITLGGVDLRQIDSTQLYRHIGFVLQDVRLIHASLRDNIALGRASASLEEIEQAARLANVHERIIALPRGYDSVVGEDAQLSGGELQRVSIARAMLLDPAILVLDEATAAADAENEVHIQQALSRFAQGRTVLVIAHRLDTVMHADHIIVIDHGRIQEQGTHAQLLASGSRYARLWRAGDYPNNQHTEHGPC